MITPIALIVGIVVGMLVVVFSSASDHYWKSKCKYCGMEGHIFNHCHKLTAKQKKALEQLASEPPTL